MIFEVTDEQIEGLNDADLRTLVAYLCEQELRAQGHSPSAVTAGGHQDAKDGGIDVRVDLSSTASVTGYVPKNATGYQVKAQDMARASLIAEMTPEGVLRPSIVELSRLKGAYVVVSSKGSLADSALTDRRNAMREPLTGTEFGADLTVDFYDRHRVAMWVNQHPALIPWVHEKCGQPLVGWRPFGDWSSSPTEIEKPYFLDDKVRLLSPSIENADGLTATDGINCLRKILANPKGIVRLVGLSGVGKTRLVQALFDDRIGSDPLNPRLAIYADISSGPDPVPLELASRLVSLKHRATLIVDNCGSELHQKLTAKIRESGSLLSLLTVEYDINDDEPEHTDVFKLESVSVDLIEKILEARFPDIAVPSRRVIAEFSDGNARIAFALASTANSGDSLANLKDKDLFKRLFEQAKGSNEGLLNVAKVCALLYSFDGETMDGEGAELPVLAGLSGVTTEQFYAGLAELVRRNLVQCRGKWRALLPHALAHRLARLALEDIPLPTLEAALVQKGSERILKSFSRRLGYMHDVPVVSKLVGKWLSSDGLLGQLGSLNRLGEAMLMDVAPVDPERTLKYIEEASGDAEKFFGEDNGNRAQVIRLLRSLAYDKALFERCVRLLERLSYLEKPGSDSCSATNVLKSLFSLYLSGTHATASQRVAFVREQLDSKDGAIRQSGLELLQVILQCGHFSSHYSFDFGARSRDFGANPRGEEVAIWFRETLEVCRAVGQSTSPVAGEVRKALALGFRDIAMRTGLLDDLDRITREFAANNGWPEGWIAVRKTLRRSKQKDPAPEEWVRKLESLAELLKPNVLADLVRSYALSKEWSALDIADTEDEDDDDGDVVSAQARVAELCLELGKQLANNAEALDQLLPELFVPWSGKVAVLGRGVALESGSFEETWAHMVLKFKDAPIKSRSSSLLGGFLEGVKLRDPIKCEGYLSSVLDDPELHTHFMNFQAHVGLSSESLPRLLRALDLLSVPTGTFQILESGRLHEGLNDNELEKFLRKLCLRVDGVPVAIEILGMRIFGAKDKPEPLGETIKSMGREVLAQDVFQIRNNHLEYMIARVIEVSMTCPRDYDLGFKICSAIIDGVSRATISPWDIGDVVQALSKTCPRAVLDGLVENQNAGRMFFGELRESRPNPLGDLPDEVILQWASEKPESRYDLLAEVIRYSDAHNEESASKEWTPLAKTLIATAPNANGVLTMFMKRFRPMSWSGSRAELCASRISLIEALKDHPRKEVAEWSATVLPVYKQNVETMRSAEASENRARDERFEN